MRNIKYLFPDSSVVSVSDRAFTHSALCLSCSNIHTQSAGCIIIILVTKDFDNAVIEISDILICVRHVSVSRNDYQ